MKIVVSPDPVLRQKCEPVSIDELPKMEKLASKMTKLMYKSDGCGIAAPQVGVSKQIIVIDTSPPQEGDDRLEEPIVILNPRILRSGEERETVGEGCLSIPGITVDIERPTEIEVEAMDLEGNTIHIEAQGFDARVLQHEMDHLEGITMFERLDVVQRATKLQEFEQAKAAGAKPGDTSVEK